MSAALPGVEHGTRSTVACGGRNAAHSAIASSAPSTSPEGEDTATSASSSRSDREAISAAASATNGSIRVVCLASRGQNLAGGHRVRGAAFADVPGGELTQGLIHRCGDAARTRQQDDLPVQIVRLDRQAASDALPGRGPGALAPGDRLDVETLPARQHVVDLVGHELDAGGAEDGPTLLLDERGQLVSLGPRLHDRIHGVRQVADQLGVLEAHDVGPRLGAEMRRRKRFGELLAAFVDPGRVPPHVDNAGHPRPVGLNDARLEVGGRRHHHRPVDVLEHTEGHPLVLDRVLQADHGRLRRGAVAQSADRAARVLALHREQDDLVAVPVESIWRGGHRDLEDHLLGRLLERQPAFADRLVMRAARDQRHLVSGLVQARADNAADRARAEDDESHAADCAPLIFGWSAAPDGGALACRTTGRRAAPASSSRRTGVVYGAFCATDGSSRASRRISATISAKWSSVSLVSVSVGSTISASSTISGKYTVGGCTPWSSSRLARSSVRIFNSRRIGSPERTNSCMQTRSYAPGRYSMTPSRRRRASR